MIGTRDKFRMCFLKYFINNHLLNFFINLIELKR